MVIRRNLQDESVRKVSKNGIPARVREKGEIEIELTSRELWDAYYLMQLKYYGQDIGEEVLRLLEDAGRENDYPEDFSVEIGEAAASRLETVIDKNDYYWETYSSMVSDVTSEYLREQGIDPDTMTRMEGQGE